jgi:MoaA/NifB/PqqE/SkfB family radical SAM enzyme
MPNVSVNINTVISAQNLEEVRELIRYVRSRGDGFIDAHYFEIVRGLPLDPSVKLVDPDKLANLYERDILPYQRELFRIRETTRHGPLQGRILSAIGAAQLTYEYRLQYRNFTAGRAWPMQCRAGKSIVVVDSNGDLSFCELRKPIASLRKEKYDITRIVASRAGCDELAAIEKDRCFCTHNCFVTESMYYDKRFVFIFLPSLLLRNLFGYSVK